MSDGGLAGWRVAVTRQADPADRLARLIREAGGEPIVEPLIRIEPPADAAPLARAARAVADYDWIVFTSANAVAALVDAAEAGGGEVVGFGRARVAAVGPATAAAAQSAGFAVGAVPAAQVGESVAAAMIEAGLRAGEAVLWPRAVGARDALLERLKAAGASVDAIDAYRTIGDAEAGARLADAVRAGRVDALTFTSPSAVRAFVSGAAAKGGLPEHRAVVAVIGPVTAASARRWALKVDVEPAEHTLEAMVAALAAARGGGSAARGEEKQ